MVWKLAGEQHGVVARRQLLALGLTPRAIEHRIHTGRLHVLGRGVYSVGRREVTLHGRWMAAVLSCGPGAALSHESAAALWALRPARDAEVEVSVPIESRSCRPGIKVHRRTRLRALVTRHNQIPVTSPICTLVDIAVTLPRGELEAVINEADKRDLVDPDSLRSELDELSPRPGVGVLRETLDHRTFTLTESQLERRFLPIARRAGLPLPETGRYVNGFRVDFHWPGLGLVVETDGLRYHRTPAQQSKDRLRDQAHTAAGLAHLRFTHSQVRFEPGHVQETLAVVARRLQRAPDSWQTAPIRR